MKFLKTTVVMFKSSKDRFVYYGRNGGIHGLNHLFKENAFFLVRLFWFLVLVTCGFCLYLLIIPILELDNEINFTIDTRYLDWNTNFPAITLCDESTEILKLAHRKLVATDYYKQRLSSLNFGHTRYLTNLAYAEGVCNHDYCDPCGRAIPCDVPWRDLFDQVRRKCDEMISDCAYNGVPFPCCEKFLPVDSEIGTCYAFNTLQNKNTTEYNLLKVNRTTGPGILTFYLSLHVQIAIHSAEELATKTMSKKFKFKISRDYDILLDVAEMENDPIVHQEYIEHRLCRFLHEIPDEPFHKYPVYGFRACELAEETEHTFEHCGCISPVRDLTYEEYFCKNYTGLNCLTKFTVQRTKLGLENDEAHQTSECLPSCVESEITIVDDSPSHAIPKKDANGLLVRIKMIDLPHLRFQRNVLRTDLDLVVSIGGVVGLFFSASILSVAELFYLLLRRRI